MKRETVVAARDFVIFGMKLWIDAGKDTVLFFGAIGAFSADLIFRREGDRRLFYKLMRAGEKFDRYLNHPDTDSILTNRGVSPEFTPDRR